MPKFTCSCGHDMNLSQGRPDFELALIPEKRIEEIADFLASEVKMTDEQFFNMIDEVKHTVYRCPVCRRLHVESRINKNHFDTYALVPSPQ